MLNIHWFHVLSQEEIRVKFSCEYIENDTFVALVCEIKRENEISSSSPFPCIISDLSCLKPTSSCIISGVAIFFALFRVIPEIAANFLPSAFNLEDVEKKATFSDDFHGQEKVTYIWKGISRCEDPWRSQSVLLLLTLGHFGGICDDVEVEPLNRRFIWLPVLSGFLCLRTHFKAKNVNRYLGRLFTEMRRLNDRFSCRF